MKWLLLITLLALGTQQTSAQSYLVLKKRNKVKVVFEVGEKVKLRLEGEKFYTHQMITGFGNDLVRFHYFDVPLAQIAEIKLTQKKPRGLNFQAFSSLFTQVGIGYLVVDQFNQVIIRGEPAGINRSTAIVSGTLVSTGLLLKLFNKKRFKIDNKKYRLEILDYMP